MKKTVFFLAFVIAFLSGAVFHSLAKDFLSEMSLPQFSGPFQLQQFTFDQHPADECPVPCAKDNCEGRIGFEEAEWTEGDDTIGGTWNLESLTFTHVGDTNCSGDPEGGRFRTTLRKQFWVPCGGITITASVTGGVERQASGFDRSRILVTDDFGTLRTVASISGIGEGSECEDPVSVICCDQGETEIQYGCHVAEIRIDSRDGLYHDPGEITFTFSLTGDGPETCDPCEPLATPDPPDPPHSPEPTPEESPTPDIDPFTCDFGIDATDCCPQRQISLVPNPEVITFSGTTPQAAAENFLNWAKARWINNGWTYQENPDEIFSSTDPSYTIRIPVIWRVNCSSNCFDPEEMNCRYRVGNFDITEISPNQYAGRMDWCLVEDSCTEPTPTPSPSPTISPSPTESPTATESPTESPTATESPTESPTATESPSPTETEELERGFYCVRTEVYMGDGCNPNNFEFEDVGCLDYTNEDPPPEGECYTIDDGLTSNKNFYLAGPFETLQECLDSNCGQ